MKSTPKENQDMNGFSQDQMPASSGFPPDSSNSNELPLLGKEICEM
jgi:hypothetical protein